MPRIHSALIAGAFVVAASPAFAQPGGPPGSGRGGGNAGPGVDAMIERMLTFDANKDGSLLKSEVTDERLHALFGRADADQDGKVSRGELRELFTKESAALAANRRGGGPMGGPGGGPPQGGPGGPGERGPGGPPPPPPSNPLGGPRGEGGDRGGFGQARGQRPRPGQVLPAGLQDRLGLSEEQRRRVDALQEIVDTQLNSILTPEQKQMLNDVGPPPGEPGPGGPPRGEGGGPGRNRPNPGNRPARPANEP